ncbi:MAG: branched-chain amino acid ABC transporter permease [Deltaproteobacteria bacterium]|nr:branched-chain amino acid ABC transporter permease [Deltaproteobacteria bacterium]
MFSKIEKSPVLTLGLIAVGFIVFGVCTSLPKITDFMIFCIFVLGFDLIYGHMGHLSFGHMLYLGAGSYGTAMFAYFVSPNPFLAIACGIVTAALLSIILGPVVVKTSGACFALLNLALNEVGAFMVLVPFPEWTGGEDGLSVYFDSYGFLDFSNTGFLFGFTLVSLLLVAYIILRFGRAPFGIFLKATKENEIRVRFLGYNTYIYKLITFIFSCSIAGFAGALNTVNLCYTNPSLIDPTRNVEVIFAALMGGAGSVMGAVIGGTAFMTISNYLARYIVRWEMFLGVALLIFAFRFREGIWGYVRKV